jgi:hypothetical protein
MGIVMDPNPPIAGQPVTITVDGPGPYKWCVFGDEWQPLPIDPETRRATITPPGSAGGGTLGVSDHGGPHGDTATAPINNSD